MRYYILKNSQNKEILITSGGKPLTPDYAPIDGNEFRRLNDLAMNVYQVRNNELFDIAMTRAAA